MKKILSKFLSPVVVTAVLFTVAGVANVLAAAEGTLFIDTINGVPPTGICVAGPITITGHGTTGGQGSTWPIWICMTICLEQAGKKLTYH